MMKKLLDSMALIMPPKLPLALLMALILLCLAWELFLAPLPTRSGWPWFAIKVLPLALAARGFVQGKLYTFKWMSLAVWLYFIEGTVRGWSDKGLSSPLAWTEAVLSVLLFMAVVLRIRQQRQIA
jgi:uncharacterized membrane protein